MRKQLFELTEWKIPLQTDQAIQGFVGGMEKVNFVLSGSDEENKYRIPSTNKFPSN